MTSYDDQLLMRRAHDVIAIMLDVGVPEAGRHLAGRITYGEVLSVLLELAERGGVRS